MKILIINTFYYPNVVGGAENVVQLLAENLYKNNNEVAIFSIDSFLSKMIIEEINGVKVYRSTGGKFNTKVRYTKEGKILQKIKNKFIELNNKKIEKEIYAVLKEFNPDVVHTNNIQGISPNVWKILKKQKIPCVHTIHDYWIANPRNLLPRNEKEILSRIHQRFFRDKSNNVNFVTAPSEFVLDSIKKCGYFKNAKSKSVANGITINIEETKEQIENNLRKEDKNIKFLFVGSLFENKGIQNLLEVFKEIESENITLDICGKGKYKDKVIQAEKNDKRIRYKGMLKKEELEEEYKKCDVLIVPSIWDEPFGMVVLEANKYGVPVIGSNKGGIQEIINNLKTGITYQYNDLNELKQAIQYFSNRENIKKYCKAIENNISKYSIENQIYEFEKIYESVKNERSSK